MDRGVRLVLTTFLILVYLLLGIVAARSYYPRELRDCMVKGEQGFPLGGGTCTDSALVGGWVVMVGWPLYVVTRAISYEQEPERVDCHSEQVRK